MNLFALARKDRRNPLGSLLGKKREQPVPILAGHPARRILTPERQFLRALELEQKRSVRSRKHFLLMLLEAPELFGDSRHSNCVSQIAKALGESIRETDPSGWYRQDWAIGVVFTEVAAADALTIRKVLNARLSAALRHRLGLQVDGIKVLFRLFPEATEKATRPASEMRGRYRGLRHGDAAVLIPRLIDLGVNSETSGAVLATAGARSPAVRLATDDDGPAA